MLSEPGKVIGMLGFDFAVLFILHHSYKLTNIMFRLNIQCHSSKYITIYIDKIMIILWYFPIALEVLYIISVIIINITSKCRRERGKSRPHSREWTRSTTSGMSPSSTYESRTNNCRRTPEYSMSEGRKKD